MKILLLFPFFILVMQFTFSHNYNQIINVALLANIFLYFYIISIRGRIKINKKRLLFLLIFILFNLFLAISSENRIEAFKSFALIANSSILIFVSFSIKIKKSDLKIFIKSYNIIIYLFLFHSCLILLQFFYMNVLNDYSLSNPFGNFSKYGPFGEPYIPFEYDIIKRPNGFYSEPSVVAWITAIVIAIYLRFQFIFNHPLHILIITLLILGPVFTFSLSGIVNITILLTFYLIIKKNRFYKKAVFFLFFLIATTLTTIFLLNNPYIYSRINEGSSEGSSTYVRVTMPLKLIKDSLHDYPLGAPLGSDEYIASRSYTVVNSLSSTSNTQIHNGIFLIVFNYGFFGLFFLTYILFKILTMMLNKNPDVLLLLSVFLAISQSGALWSPYYLIVFFYIIVFFNFFEKIQKGLHLYVK